MGELREGGEGGAGAGAEGDRGGGNLYKVIAEYTVLADREGAGGTEEPKKPEPEPAGSEAGAGGGGGKRSGGGHNNCLGGGEEERIRADKCERVLRTQDRADAGGVNCETKSGGPDCPV